MIPAPVGAGKNTKNVMGDENSSEFGVKIFSRYSQLGIVFIFYSELRTHNSELFREAA